VLEWTVRHINAIYCLKFTLSVFGVDVNSGPPVELQYSSDRHITGQVTTKLHVSFSRMSVLHNCALRGHHSAQVF